MPLPASVRVTVCLQRHSGNLLVGQGVKPIPQVLKEVRAYKGLTGTVRIDGKRVNRDMAVVELHAGNAKFSKLVKVE